eukprot:291713-Chlamydomonas_euryale.AAC.3
MILEPSHRRGSTRSVGVGCAAPPLPPPPQPAAPPSASPDATGDRREGPALAPERLSICEAIVPERASPPPLPNPPPPPPSKSPDAAGERRASTPAPALERTSICEATVPERAAASGAAEEWPRSVRAAASKSCSAALSSSAPRARA